MILRRLALTLSLIVLVALPLAILAAPPGALNLPIGLPDTIDEVRRQIVCRAIGWVFTLSLIAGFTFVLLAAYSYLFSEGSAEKVEAAHRALAFAAVGIGVALLSTAVPYIVGSIVSGGQGGGGIVRNYCPGT